MRGMNSGGALSHFAGNIRSASPDMLPILQTGSTNRRSGVEVDPLGVVRQFHVVAGNARDYVDVSVGVRVVMLAVDKAHVEAFHVQGDRDPFSQFVQYVPDLPLFADVSPIHRSS